MSGIPQASLPHAGILTLDLRSGLGEHRSFGSNVSISSSIDGEYMNTARCHQLHVGDNKGFMTPNNDHWPLPVRSSDLGGRMCYSVRRDSKRLVDCSILLSVCSLVEPAQRCHLHQPSGRLGTDALYIPWAASAAASAPSTEVLLQLGAAVFPLNFVHWV